jgi:stage III sporulation protein AG
VLTEIEPTVRGVIVIAEGAADVSVRVKLSNAVMTVLGISADRIEVFEMKRGEGEQ